MKFILLFPGQGSQKPGMGRDLAQSFPAARDTFEQIDDALGYSLSALCFDGPQAELTETRNAQPALFAHGAAAWSVVRDALAPHVVAAAGHSLGELTAYHAAGTLSLAGGARLVRERGSVMFDIGSERPGTMAAIIGTLNAPIEEICKRATRGSGARGARQLQHAGADRHLRRDPAESSARWRSRRKQAPSVPSS